MLGENGIDYRTIGFLKSQLDKYQQPNIRVLKLAKNLIGDTGCQIIARIILSERGRNIVNEIDLSHNNITYIGFYHLSIALVLESQIKILRISNNQIGVQGGILLGEILRFNNVLKGVDINNNNINDAGIERIIDAMYLNTTLEYLDICKYYEF